MIIDLNVIITGLLAPVAVLLVKTLLDFNLARSFVKYFWWFPARGLFRSNPIVIKGKWEQVWGSGDSINFPESSDRHSNQSIRQFGPFCYTEFHSKSKTYAVFGRIINDHFIGDWHDKNDKNGYFGAFQLQIIDSNTMSGRWIGHSKTKFEVKGDIWKWSKLNSL